MRVCGYVHIFKHVVWVMCVRVCMCMYVCSVGGVFVYVQVQHRQSLRVFGCGCVDTQVGDGELQEGQNYEALMTMTHFNMTNITIFVDCTWVHKDHALLWPNMPSCTARLCR